MNVAQMLMHKTTKPIGLRIRATKDAPKKPKPLSGTSWMKYRNFLKGNKRTVADIAKAFNYTVEGVAGTLRRYKKEGKVKVVGKISPQGSGRPAQLWTWHGG